MKRALLLSIFAGLAGSAMAQFPSVPTNVFKTRLTVGYGISGEFPVGDGGSGHLEGPTLGIEFPVLSLADTDLAVGASWFGGGRLSHGSDIDGDVYRFVGTVRHRINTSGLYVKVGAGYARCSDRSGNFDGDSGSIALFAIGGPLTSGPIRQAVPNWELSYITAGSGQLRGFFVGLTAGL